MTIGDSNTPVSFTPAEINVIEEPLIQIETPPISQGDGIGEGSEEVPPQAEEFTIESSKHICKSLLNTPGMFFGDHLLFEDGETDNFAIEFQQYCNRKGINPYDYLFDEIGLAIAGLGLFSLFLKRHKTHKEQEKKKEGREKSTKEREEKVEVEVDMEMPT